MSDVLSGQIRLEAVNGSARQIIDSINGLLLKAGCPEDARRKMDTAMDEIVSNIVEYAYPDAAGSLELDYDIRQGCARLCFKDSGVQFNPLEQRQPDLNAVNIGGWGIYFARSIMDSITYEYKDGRNCLTVQKNW